MEQAKRFGELLHSWRGSRGKSQLQLSFDSGISQRHISFVESGRSRPSREVVLALAGALNVPLRERNGLLSAAGYAPQYAEARWDSAEMQGIFRAVSLMLKQHEPYPALVLDRHWNVLDVNEATPLLFRQLMNLDAFPKPRNLLHLVFNPKALRPAIENWEQVAAGLLERVHREAVGQILDRESLALLEELRAYPGVEELPPAPRAAGAVIPINFRKGEHRSSWFSLVTTVGTPQYVSAQELRIECMFPAGEQA